ncbi:MAG TPA: hypothetical protein VLF93_02675 [Candidatus Saccharimonadales bacterium]|nr:hypothetical protein [Candidatus Saccharimonadales bacterium]
MDGEERQESTPQRTNGSGAGKTIGVIAIIIILAIAGLVYESQAKQKTPTQTAVAPEKKISAAPASPTTTATMSASKSASKSTYKDGTYTAEGDYITHVGHKKIGVTITLKNDIITSADVKNEADDPDSTQYQDSFISGYKPMVVGKDISTIHLTKVAQSSLTPNGFNAALKTIEQQAKS